MTTPTAEVSGLPPATTAQSAVSRGVRRESAWLFAGYVLTAAIGFVFWIVAARTLPAATLGVDAGLLSLVTAAAAFASSGLGTAMVVMLGHGGGAALVRRASQVAVGLGALLGAGVGVAAHAFIVPDLPIGLVIAVMSASCAVWSLMTLQGQALTGYGRAPLTVAVNGPANLGKLLLLAAASAGILAIPHVAFLSTIVPAAIAVAVVGLVLLPRVGRRHEASRTSAPPLPAGTPGFAGYAARDTVALGLTLGLGLSLTFFVTVLAGPAAGALFSIAYQYAMLLDLVTASVSTALSRGASTDADLHGQAFSLWLRTAAVVAVAAILAVGVSPVVFELMGPSYDVGTGVAVVAAFAGGSVARCGYELWCGLQRARRRAGRIIAWNAVGAAVALLVVFLAVPQIGALGGALGALAHGVVLGLVGAVGLRRARSAS